MRQPAVLTEKLCLHAACACQLTRVTGKNGRIVAVRIRSTALKPPNAPRTRDLTSHLLKVIHARTRAAALLQLQGCFRSWRLVRTQKHQGNVLRVQWMTKWLHSRVLRSVLVRCASWFLCRPSPLVWWCSCARGGWAHKWLRGWRGRWKELTTVVRGCHQRWQRRRKHQVMSAWRGLIQQQKRMRRVMARFAQQGLSKCLQRWREGARSLAWARAVVSRVLGRMQHAALLGAFNSWVDFATTRQSQRRVADRVLARFLQSALAAAWGGWLESARWARRARSTVASVLQRMQHACAAFAFARCACL